MANNGEADGVPLSNGDTNGESTTTIGDAGAPFSVKAGLAQMLKGGVIMDVVNAEQVGSYSRDITWQMGLTAMYRRE